jgi:hypothetical protein
VFEHAAWKAFQNDRIITNKETQHVMYERIVFKGRIFVVPVSNHQAMKT